MRIKNVLIVGLMIVAACSGRKAPNGLELEVIHQGEGEFAKPGEYLVMSMLYMDSKDSIWADTRKQDIPVVINVADVSRQPEEKGVESCFRVLKKGDSVRVRVTARSLFEDTWKTQLPPKVNPEDTITFILSVKDITNNVGFNKIQEELQAKQMALMKKQEEVQLAADISSIDEFLEINKIAAIKDESGLRCVITRKGRGAKPAPTSTVRVNYKGSLLEDGTVFDQSGQPVEYPLASLVRGWQIGFPMLPKGSKAVFYIPSSLGYGPNGYPPSIPANANLVFEVELLDFK